MKHFTGQSKQSDLCGLANSVASGDHRHYLKSWKETVVHETVEKSRRLSG